MNPLVRTARATGLLYLGLALTGMLGFLIIRPRLFDPDDPAATLANLVAHESVARAGVALELGIVLTQTLTAVWFYRLFRTVDDVAAGAIAAFGLINGIAILVSAALLGTTVGIAGEPAGDAAATVQTLYLLSDNMWGVGNLFFGLWLIPMGMCVLRSGWMPRPLGWVLIVGGVGYVLGGLVRYLLPDAGIMVEALAVPASVGEFWMIAYLLVRGVRRTAPAEAPTPNLAPAT